MIQYKRVLNPLLKLNQQTCEFSNKFDQSHKQSQKSMRIGLEVQRSTINGECYKKQNRLLINSISYRFQWLNKVKSKVNQEESESKKKQEVSPLQKRVNRLAIIGVIGNVLLCSLCAISAVATHSPIFGQAWLYGSDCISLIAFTPFTLYWIYRLIRRIFRKY